MLEMSMVNGYLTQRLGNVSNGCRPNRNLLAIAGVLNFQAKRFVLFVNKMGVQYDFAPLTALLYERSIYNVETMAQKERRGPPSGLEKKSASTRSS
jgi:hypothetical protein